MKLSLLQQFEAQVLRVPDACAVVSDEGKLTFSQLNRRAEEIASMLPPRSGPDGLVGLCAEPSPGFIAGMLGILKAGYAWVPLEPGYPAERLHAICEAARLEMILAGREQQDIVSPMNGAVICLDDVPAAEAEQSFKPVSHSPDDLAYVMFTSGSTGEPKGVMVSHANTAGLFEELKNELGFSSNDCWSTMHSPAFGFSVWEMWGALSTGACLQIVAADSRNDPAAWLKKILDGHVSILSITPSGFRQLLAADCLPAVWEHLRLVVFSGEPVRENDIERWFELFPGTGPRLVNTYALTETAGRICWYEYKQGKVPVAGSIGTPVADAEVCLLDAEANPVARGAEGELYIAGPMLARGYLNDPGLSAEKFVCLESADGHVKRFYKSGDRARFTRDGELVFVGRQDDQIKLRGHRIELADIEQALRCHPAVSDAAVVVQEHNEVKRLAAFIVPAANEEAAREGPEFWPSLGEYQVYDDLLYDFMSADEVRVAGYQRAFARQARGKVVLDIGTGKDAILARLCAAAGAKKVYAVEVLDDACEQAQQLVTELGLDDVIEVLHGDLQDLDIPEPVELCTQGIVGNIGSSDGIVPIWNSARRFFANDFVAVPSACTTYFAPAELPGGSEQAAFGSLAADYTRRIFAAAGKPFDIRLCVRNFPVTNMLAEAAIFEQLDFDSGQAEDLSADYTAATGFSVSSSGNFDGFLLWTRIATDASESVDFFEHQQAWLPVWFPVTDSSVPVQAGDRIEVRWKCRTPAGQVFPDYECQTSVIGADGSRHEFAYASAHYEQSLGETALHRALLMSLEDSDSAPAEWLRARLPDYMQPSVWAELPGLPLNSNGKIDRIALREYRVDSEVSSARQSDSVFADEFESAIAQIWRDVLKLDVLAPDDDFFAAGGDSILAVRLTTEVQRYLDETVFLTALFDAPTVRSYANWLREHHPQSVADRDTPVETQTSEIITAKGAGPHRLSWPQQSLWFLHQLYPDNTGANEQFLIRVKGSNDTERLCCSWQAVTTAHDILRTVITVDAATGQPRQQVYDPAEFECRPVVHDLRGMGKADAEAALYIEAGECLAESFDLGQPPLLRPTLFRLDGEMVLVVTAHHIIADGMCVQLIRDELSRAWSQGSLPRPELQYADFSNSQQNQGDHSFRDELNWWQKNLAGHDGRPVSAVTNPSARGEEARFGFEIPATLAEDLRSLAQRHGATPFMLLLAAWRIWLARCLMERDLLLGSPVTMRKDESTAGMMGCMVNNLVFRNAVDRESDFIQLLLAEREQVLAALARSDVPFEKIVESLAPEREFGRHPLFQLMFLFEDRSSPDVNTGDAVFSSDVLPVDRASYWDLELSVADCGPGLAMQAYIGVRRDIFDADALGWWPEGFVAMLKAVVREPEKNVAGLPLLSPAQRHRILVEWNDTRLDTGADTTLHGLVEMQAGLSPSRIAVRDYHEELTYAELVERARRYAMVIAGQADVQGKLVGMHIGRSADAIALQLGILMSGAAWLPLDPSYPVERIGLMIEDAGPALVVSDNTDCVDAARLISAEALRAQAAGVDPAACKASEPFDLAYALFTSGSTGRPKGILATHASAVSRCRWMWQVYGFVADDVFAQRTSLNFVDSVWEIYGALAHGACVDVLPPAFETDSAAMAGWLEERGVTHLVVIPTLLRTLLDLFRGAGGPGQLHTVITSGESLSISLTDEFFTTLNNVRLLNTYGTSETWDVSCYEVRPEDAGAQRIPVGKPVGNASLCILDESLQPLPPGVSGELYAGGIGLAQEYIGRPDITREQFLQNHLDELDTARLYRTGDVARFRADGTVELLGRSDRQIKLRGLRIETAEIEYQAQQFKGIKNSVVVLQGGSGGDEWLSLYLEPEPDVRPDCDRLREFLQTRLPRAMVPAEIVLLDNLPLTPSGKLDVLALPASEYSEELKQSYVEPQGELQTTIATIWAEALELEKVGANENFFALRGHSLLATRVIARVGEELGIEVPLQCLFEAPTVAGMAGSIEALRWASGAETQGHGSAGDREIVRL